MHKDATACSARLLHPLASAGDHWAQRVVAVISHIGKVQPSGVSKGVDDVPPHLHLDAPSASF